MTVRALFCKPNLVPG